MPRRSLLGHVLEQVLLQRVRARIVEAGVGDRRGPGAVPGLQLPLDVARLLAELAQADRVRIDRVKFREHVDERVRETLAAGFGQPPSRVVRDVERVAIDEAHQVEVRAGHRRVGAEPERPGYRHRSGPQRADQRPLATHVVRLGQQLAQRRAPDHRPAALRVLEQVGQVRVPAFELRPGQRQCEAGQVALDPGFDSRRVVARRMFGVTHVVDGSACRPDLGSGCGSGCGSGLGSGLGSATSATIASSRSCRLRILPDAVRGSGVSDTRR